jgi:hypothetical protein
MSRQQKRASPQPSRASKPHRARQCFLALAVLASCSSTERLTPADSTTDVALRWTFERRWAVGGVGDTHLQMSAAYPDDLGVDSTGHLWIIDHSENRVVEYDSAGKQQRSLGRRGRGPGEFAYPASIQFLRTGEIRVYDMEKESIVVFAADGSVRPEEQPHRRLRNSITLANGDLVGLRYAPDTTILRTVTNGDVRALASFVPAGLRPIPDACSLIGQTSSPVFSPTMEFAVRGNLVAYTTGEFRVNIYESGKPERVLSRAAPRRKATIDMARQHLGRGLPIEIVGRPVCYIAPDIILGAVGAAKELPAYERLVIAPDGRIWAQRFTVRDEPRFADIYHPTQGYEGTVTLGAVKPTAFLLDGSVVSLERDESDVPIVVVYRLRVP